LEPGLYPGAGMDSRGNEAKEPRREIGGFVLGAGMPRIYGGMK
jgi:hypothetical protein